MLYVCNVGWAVDFFSVSDDDFDSKAIVPPITASAPPPIAAVVANDDFESCESGMLLLHSSGLYRRYISSPQSLANTGMHVTSMHRKTDKNLNVLFMIFPLLTV
jgi:hypothetical protein